MVLVYQCRLIEHRHRNCYIYEISARAVKMFESCANYM